MLVIMQVLAQNVIPAELPSHFVQYYPSVSQLNAISQPNYIQIETVNFVTMSKKNPKTRYAISVTAYRSQSLLSYGRFQ